MVPEGETTTDYRAFDRDPALHTIVITLPNDSAGPAKLTSNRRIKCVAINSARRRRFRVSLPLPGEHLRRRSVHEGEDNYVQCGDSYTAPLRLTSLECQPSGAKYSQTLKQIPGFTDLPGKRPATLVVDDVPAKRHAGNSAGFNFIPPTPRARIFATVDVCCSCPLTTKRPGSITLR